MNSNFGPLKKPDSFWALEVKMPSGKKWYLGTSKDLIALYEDTDKAMQFPSYLDAAAFYRTFKEKAHDNHHRFVHSFVIVKIESGH